MTGERGTWEHLGGSYPEDIAKAKTKCWMSTDK